VVRLASRLVGNPAFDRVFLAIILVNAVVLGAETYPAVERDAGDTLHLLNDVFLARSSSRSCSRFAATGFSPRRYLSNGWNVFDLIVVGGAFVPGCARTRRCCGSCGCCGSCARSGCCPTCGSSSSRSGARCPASGSLALLTVLLLFVYGMVGWVIFDEHDPAAYGTIGNAMLTLFVMLTLENLPDNIEMGRELSEWTILYFLSFALLAAFVLFNLFIGSSSTRWRRRGRSSSSGPSGRCATRTRATTPARTRSCWPTACGPCAARSRSSSARSPRRTGRARSRPSSRVTREAARGGLGEQALDRRALLAAQADAQAADDAERLPVSVGAIRPIRPCTGRRRRRRSPPSA
jgi:voltage-gated sodium channel